MKATNESNELVGSMYALGTILVVLGLIAILPVTILGIVVILCARKIWPDASTRFFKQLADATSPTLIHKPPKKRRRGRKARLHKPR